MHTLGAISLVAYVLANVLHEGAGHAGACLALGCDAQVLTTAYFESDSRGLGDAAPRLISAAGTLANLVAGGCFLWLHRRVRHGPDSLRYFLWLSLTVNLLVGTGYPLFSGVLGTGDWMRVVEGRGPAGLWRLALVVTGVLLYGAAIWVALRELAGLVGTGADRKERAVRLTVPAYLIGSLGSTLGAFLNPSGAVFIMTSAAAHFGGTSGLAWMAQMLDTRWFSPIGRNPVRIGRSIRWVILAAAVLALHVLMLGPGVRL